MGKRFGWLVVLLVVALLVAACGPEMATPTPGTESADTSPSATVADASPSATVEKAGETSESQPAASAELPVDEDDWHVLGSPDAPVTIVDYSDFQ
jgi:protein-disulfide isomerase